MKTFGTIWKLCVAGSVIVASGIFFSTATLAATYTVNTTNDGDDGTCTHPYVDAANDCTLHEAIDASNANAGADTITFNISTDNFADDGDGQFTITTTAALPTITEAIELTAVSMWDSAGATSDRPGIRILGSGSSDNDGIHIGAGADNTEVKSIEVDGFDQSGFTIATADSLTIGTDCDGSNDAKERNVIINNGYNGISISGSDNSVIAGNYIGIGENGTTDAGNGEDGSVWGMAGIWLTNGDNNIIGYSSSSCTAAAQRNIISGTGALEFIDLSNNSGIVLDGGGSGNDSTNNRIVGNYIGTNAAGTTAVPNVGTGIYLTNAATYNFVGTDGDGVNDSNEGNVISGNMSHGIFVWGSASYDAVDAGGPDHNRIAGNWIGFGSTGTSVPNEANGINVRQNDIIIGWCDATIDATLCNDAGSLANQRNYIMGGANENDDGIRLGVRADDVQIYGNKIGLSPTDASIVASAAYGIGVNSENTTDVIGGSSSNQQNEITNHDAGVAVFRNTDNNTQPISEISVTGNNIHNNTTDGIYCARSSFYASEDYTYEVTVNNNTIADNGSNGINLAGCSWDLQNNTITGNGTYGIYVTSVERPDDTTPYDNPYDALSPNNYSNDIISNTRIQNNTIGDNTSGGIYLLDNKAVNSSTLITDNTLNDNNSQFRLKQDWYAAIEILNNGTTPYTSGNHTVNLQPAAGSCTNCSGSTLAADGAGLAISGPSGLNYNDASTWFTITDFEVNASGQTVNYNPYTIKASGDTVNQTGSTYTFDGTNNDSVSVGGLPNGILTENNYRYQIAEVKSSSVPATPTNTLPANGATGVSRTPTLSTSAFSDTSETHTSTTWRVYSTSALCTAGGTGNVLNTTSTSAKTSLTLSTALTAETTYYWRVAYKNSFDNTSSYSSCTSFTTIRTQPTFTGTIPDQTWDEDAELTNAFDLDTYFSDAENEELSYSVENVENNISIDSDADNVISFSSEDNWNGSSTVTFTACDPDGECVSSNEFTTTVNSVNDAPSTPLAGFSPADGERTSSQSPKLSWQAATDIDHAASQLSYQIRLGKNTDPTTTYAYQATTAANKLTHKVQATLDDETTYYYVVRTIDPDGAKSDWSEIQSFFVNTLLEPEITLTKEVTLVDGTSTTLQNLRKLSRAIAIASIQPALAQPAYVSIAHTVENLIFGVIWVSLLLFGLSLISLMAMGRSFRDTQYLLVKQPAVAFSTIHQSQQVTVKQVSFYHFKKRIVLFRTIIATSLLLFISALSVNATRVTLIQQGVQSVINSITVEPLDHIQVAVSFNNIGDGDATSVMVIDPFPAGTTYVQDSIQVSKQFAATTNVSTNNAQVTLGTIQNRDQKNNRSGTIRYELQINNPYVYSNVSIPAARLSASEFDTVISSNELQIALISASIQGTVSEIITRDVIPNVVVSIMQGDTVISFTKTDTNGSYSFNGLASGVYIIQVAAPDPYENPDDFTISLIAGQSYPNQNITVRYPDSPNVDPIIKDPTDDNEENGDETDEEESTNEEESDDTSDVILPDERFDVPNELLEDFINVTLRTDDEREEADHLSNQLVVTELNNYKIVNPGQRLYVGTNRRLLQQFAQGFEKILLPKDTEDFVLTGLGPPNSRITISICYALLETETDQSGQWVMTIPRDILQPGENAIFATAEQDDVVSNQVEVARIVIEDESELSRTSLLSSIMFFLSAMLVILFAYYNFIHRRNISIFTIKQKRAWLWLAGILTLLSLVVFAGTIIVYVMRTYNLTARLLPNQATIALTTFNDTPADIDTPIIIKNAKHMSLVGTAPAETTMAITFCDNRPMKTITVDESKNWSADFPISLLPKGQFQVSAQVIADNQFGAPHRLSNVGIESKTLSRYGQIFLVTSYLLLMLAAFVFWVYVRQQIYAQTITPESNPSDS